MTFRPILGFGLAAVIALPALAQSVPPAWERRPEPDIPVFASTIMVDGSALLNCVVSTLGTLTDCEVREETPDGLGFGEAALDATASARLVPRTVDGTPVAARVEFRVNFATDPVNPPDPAPYSGPRPSDEALALATEIVGSFDLPPASEMTAEYRLRDPDDTARIEALVLEQTHAMQDQAEAVIVLGTARVMPVEQMRAYLGGRPFEIPPRAAIEEASRAEAHAFSIALADRLRAAWCARYGPCAPVTVIPAND